MISNHFLITFKHISLFRHVNALFSPFFYRLRLLTATTKRLIRYNRAYKILIRPATAQKSATHIGQMDHRGKEPWQASRSSRLAKSALYW